MNLFDFDTSDPQKTMRMRNFLIVFQEFITSQHGLFFLGLLQQLAEGHKENAASVAKSIKTYDCDTEEGKLRVGKIAEKNIRANEIDSLVNKLDPEKVQKAFNKLQALLDVKT